MKILHQDFLHECCFFDDILMRILDPGIGCSERKPKIGHKNIKDGKVMSRISKYLSVFPKENINSVIFAIIRYLKYEGFSKSKKVSSHIFLLTHRTTQW